MNAASLVLAALLALMPVSARSSGSHSHSSKSKCTSCARDSKGKIKRSTNAKRDFQRSHPCPSTGSASGACPGYVIDHVKPLKRGGSDSPSNMQWQTTSAAKAKDRVEQSVRAV
jgi:hypothetical protein